MNRRKHESDVSESGNSETESDSIVSSLLLLLLLLLFFVVFYLSEIRKKIHRTATERELH